MPHGKAIVDQLFKGVDADPEMLFHEILRHFQIAFGCLDSFGDHRLIAHQEQGARGDLVEEAHGEDRRGLHIDRVGTDSFQVFFEGLIVFPYPA